MTEPGWKRRIRELIASHSTTMKAVSKAAGKGETYVRDILERDRDPSIENLRLIAGVLGVTAQDLLDESEDRIVKVVGRVGAGAEILPEFEQVPPEGLAEIELPFPVPAAMIAFEVSGDSMLPRYDDGDVIVVFREQQRPIEAFYGEEAAVRTDRGRRFLKRIARGSLPHTVNLESFNAKTIESVKIDWIGEIWLALRAGQVRRLNERERVARRSA